MGSMKGLNRVPSFFIQQIHTLIVTNYIPFMT